MREAVRKILLYLAAAALVGMVVPLAVAEFEWQKISDADGIVVYQRQETNSKIVSLRAEGTVAAAPKVVFEVMKNNAEAAEWIPMVVERADIKAVSERERIEYTHVSPPWPIADRYFVNSGSAEFLADGSIKIVVKSLPSADLQPAWRHDDMILGELLRSEFFLRPVQNGTATALSFIVQTDPKGLIPKWLVNLTQKSWPREFFSGLNGQLRRKGLLNNENLSH